MCQSVRKSCLLVMVLLAVASYSSCLQAAEGEGRFAIGVTYVNGFSDVEDFIENDLEAQGYTLDDTLSVPVGLTLVGGYRFASGVEILADAGPFSMYYVDVITGPVDEYTHWDLPVGLTAGYALLPDQSISPYVRGGARYHFTGGDFADSSSVGPYVAAGINFFSDREVQMQLEIAYDGSTVDFVGLSGATDEIETGGILASLRIAF